MQSNIYIMENLIQESKQNNKTIFDKTPCVKKIAGPDPVIE